MYLGFFLKNTEGSRNFYWIIWHTDYGRPVRKSPSLHDQKSTPTPNFLGTAEAYFVCHIGPNFQISLIFMPSLGVRSPWSDRNVSEIFLTLAFNLGNSFHWKNPMLVISIVFLSTFYVFPDSCILWSYPH